MLYELVLRADEWDAHLYGAVAQSVNTATNLDRNGFPAACIGAKA
jgi:hypothetical protein